jgi:hypothetical protein
MGIHKVLSTLRRKTLAARVSDERKHQRKILTRTPNDLCGGLTAKSNGELLHALKANYPQNLHARSPCFSHRAFHSVLRLPSGLFCRRLLKPTGADVEHGRRSRHVRRVCVRAAWNFGGLGDWNRFVHLGPAARTHWIFHCTRLVASDCLRPRRSAGGGSLSAVRQASNRRWKARRTAIRASRAGNI